MMGFFNRNKEEEESADQISFKDDVLKDWVSVLSALEGKDVGIQTTTTHIDGTILEMSDSEEDFVTLETSDGLVLIPADKIVFIHVGDDFSIPDEGKVETKQTWNSKTE